MFHISEEGIFLFLFFVYIKIAIQFGFESKFARFNPNQHP